MESDDARERWRWPGKRARSGGEDSDICTSPIATREMAGSLQLSPSKGLADATAPQNDQLLLPNFLADANKLVDLLDAKEGKSHEDTTSPREREHIVHELIDARINSLSGLFRPLHRKSEAKTRATDMTDRELSDWVLKGACSETFLRSRRKEEQADEDEGESEGNSVQRNPNDELVKQIEQQYQSRREELRSMARGLSEGRRRRILAEPTGTAPAAPVRMDRHGRLVPVRGETMNTQGGEAGGVRGEEIELEDASQAFWRQSSAAKEQPGKARDRRRGTEHRPSEAQPPPLITNQPMRLREISQQMDRDATDAIQRALDRYRREEGEQLGFELVHIPLRDPADENDFPRLSFFRRNRGRQLNDDPHEHAHGQERNGEGERENGGVDADRHLLDLRLTVRRILFAVITVAAAFICIMFQGLPLHFGDETSFELDDRWISGLMGPHFQGHLGSFQVAGNGDAIPEEEDEDPLPFAMFRPKRPPGGPPDAGPSLKPNSTNG
ncbi:hypothetical protein ACHAXT_009321 [Thalassiosira profunda]